MFGGAGSSFEKKRKKEFSYMDHNSAFPLDFPNGHNFDCGHNSAFPFDFPNGHNFEGIEI